jgi:DNA-binding NarL/FixJ family response regulator
MTPRQKDIVQLLAEGRSMKEIAGVLELSQKTVEFHKHHIMVSFNFRSNADLFLFALNHGLISPNPEMYQFGSNREQPVASGRH